MERPNDNALSLPLDEHVVRSVDHHLGTEGSRTSVNATRLVRRAFDGGSGESIVGGGGRASGPDLLPPTSTERLGATLDPETLAVFGPQRISPTLPGPVRFGRATQVVRSFLTGGGSSADFSWHTGDSLAHLINWTDSETQPAPIFPGDIYIAPTTEDGVMLISPSESGTRFCAVIKDTTVERGTVDPERFPPDPNSLNTPFDPYPGPVACTPGGWPG